MTTSACSWLSRLQASETQGSSLSQQEEATPKLGFPRPQTSEAGLSDNFSEQLIPNPNSPVPYNLIIFSSAKVFS